jgi:sugar-specific transcriptional regulator TrmB
MNTLKNLERIGLTENEAAIYTYLLGTSIDQSNTAFAIARNTKIPRSTAYLTIDSLLQKRLVSSFTKNNVLHFLAENPKALKADIEAKYQAVNDLIPVLLELRNDTVMHPNVKTYAGREGVRIVFDDIYDSPHLKGIREFHTISNPNLVDYIPRHLPKLLEYKKKINIFTKLIASAEAKASPIPEYTTDSHKEVRFLPKGINLDGTIVVYGKKVAILGLKESEVYSVIIESPVISQMMDSLFACIWELIKE